MTTDPSARDRLCLQLAARLATIQYHPWLEEEALITREELTQLAPEDVEQHILPRLLDIVLADHSTWGWRTPPPPDDWGALKARVATDARRMAESGEFSTLSRVGLKNLRAHFGAFWRASSGPAVLVADRDALTPIVAYRIGLNKTGEVYDFTPKTLRRGFFSARKVVSMFKPVTAGAIWSRWMPEGLPPVVWDPSAGFGARMLGFLSVFPEGTYIANEPAEQTFAEASLLASFLCGEAAARQVVITRSGSEIEGPTQPVSMVFTSPPYFDKEQYFDEPGQCWRDYPSAVEWRVRYLVPTIRRAADVLLPGGRLVLNVDGPRRDAVLSAAEDAGLKLLDEQTLRSGPDHFLRAQGKEGVAEPILVFEKTAPRCRVSIPGTGGAYSVCDDGTVLSYAREAQGLQLKGYATPAGYRAVGLYAEEGGKPQSQLIHRLVCHAFHGPPPSDQHTDVRHLNGDKADNRAENLAWGTRSENMQDVLRHRQEGAAAVPDAAKAPTWYGGRTADTALVQVCLDLFNETRLQIVDVARLLDCTESVAFNLMRGRTGAHTLVDQRPAKVRRSLERKAQICALIAEGRTRVEVNATLSEMLSAQDFYYYSQVVKSRTRASEAG
jgi:hypothetical protein